MKEQLTPAMRKAVREYYEWHGDKRGSANRIVSRPGRYGRDYMILAHVTDADGEKISTLMYWQNWKDGHVDVTEDYAFRRECEKQCLEEWRDEGREDVKLYKAQCEHPEYFQDGDDDDDTYDPNAECEAAEEVHRRKRTYDGGYEEDGEKDGAIL